MRSRSPRGVDSMRELVVVSGKGGTGKTSLTASFAVLARAVRHRGLRRGCRGSAPCPCPAREAARGFRAGHEAVINPALCTACGLCRRIAASTPCAWRRKASIGPDSRSTRARARAAACACDSAQSAPSIFRKGSRGNGMYRIPDAARWCMPGWALPRRTPGKLVSLVRREAREIAEREGRELLLVDGPPGSDARSSPLLRERAPCSW